MNLSISQMQNVLRTYQSQVREEKVKAILGSREAEPGWHDRVDISKEGRSRLEDDGNRREPGSGGNQTER